MQLALEAPQPCRRRDFEPAVEDEQVILSIYEEVAEHFRVNRRAVMLTGCPDSKPVEETKPAEPE